MTAETFALPQAIRDEITQHAKHDAPREACGVITARPGRFLRLLPPSAAQRVARFVPARWRYAVRRVIRLRNVAPDAAIRYDVDRSELLQMQRSMESEGETDLTLSVGEPFAIYHSHPRSAAFPSPTDRAQANWPYSLFVLVSLRAEDPEIRAFRIENDHPGSEKTVTEVRLTP